MTKVMIKCSLCGKSINYKKYEITIKDSNKSVESGGYLCANCFYKHIY